MIQNIQNLEGQVNIDLTLPAENIRMDLTSTLEIHTNKALILFQGQRDPDKQSFPPLTYFSRTCHSLIDAVMADDPHADYSLIQIEKQMDICDQKINQQLEKIIKIEERAKYLGYHINFAKCINPATLPLKFGNEYGRMGARLIAQFDKMNVRAMALRLNSMITRKTYETMIRSNGERPIRYLFELARISKISGVTRTQHKAGAAEAFEALEKKGKIPENVISGELRSVLTSIQK